MQLKNLNIYFLLVLIIGVSVIIFFMFRPFLVPLIIAAILAQLFHPVYLRLMKMTKQRAGISSGLTCLLVGLIIIVPLFFVASLTVNEVAGIINDFSNGASRIGKIVQSVNDVFSGNPYFKSLNIRDVVNQETVLSLAKSVSQNTLSIFQSTYRGVGHFVFVSFIMFFSLFYLLIDGKKFIGVVMRFSPLRDKYESRLVDKFISIARATIKGTSLIAVMQGFIGSILFLATGVSSPILLGVLMTISSLIPTIGSGLVWFPAGVIMILLGYTTKGVIILLVGALAIASVDNILRQKLIGKDVQMHPLLILFSTLGGLVIFGLTGFIIGPIIMALFLALWEIYLFEFGDQLEEFNK